MLKSFFKKSNFMKILELVAIIFCDETDSMQKKKIYNLDVIISFWIFYGSCNIVCFKIKIILQR